MRRIKEVLRLRYELGLRPTADRAQLLDVANALLLTTCSALRRPDSLARPEDLDGEHSPMVRPAAVATASAAGFRQLKRHSNLTLALISREYHSPTAIAIRDSASCPAPAAQKEAVLQQEHKAGEKLFVDWPATPFGFMRPPRADAAGALIRRGVGS
jgi:hypothetical protein